MSTLPRDLVPTSYELAEAEQELHLSWSDGHESIFNYTTLRRACPCAWCAGEGDYPGNMTPTISLTEQQITLYELLMVGRYGLTPVWGDGHKTGIYTYERLRNMCECTECQQPRS